ncbi:MAG TPA: response regulator [Myxococcota bacterium]|nr:response regulator [Myxococcota bacterium]
MSQGRILAVDDQLYFRVYLEDLLREAGFEVQTHANGADALSALEANAYDVVITDLVMPGMDGSELVQRVKERWPEQEIIVVTSVGDVKTAVDAMKLGATDYLLKPLDRTALLRSLGTIRERRRMREENRRLNAENLEHLSAFAQYERILALFATQSLEQLADRVVEALCLETNAHGGVAWIARPEAPERLRLAGVSGLVRVEDERADLHAAHLPPELAPLAEPNARPQRGPAAGGAGRACLFVPLARAGRLLGFVRLTDKLDGSEFGDADMAAAERLAAFAAQALANGYAVRALERRSFRDPVTRAYTKTYLDDMVEHEIQKSRRFSRSFSVVRVEVDRLADAWAGRPHSEVEAMLAEFAATLARGLRASDLLAIESDGRYFALLPETDGIGAAVGKRRLRSALERCESLRALPDAPAVLAAAASFPADGATPDALWETLATRIGEDRASFVRARELEQAPFRGLVDSLLAEAPAMGGALTDQATVFLLDEVGRRPHERGLLFIGAGGALSAPIRSALEQLRGLGSKTEVVLVAERGPDEPPGLPVTWVSPLRAGTEAPFVLYYGDRPAYALVREPDGDEREASLYHTADRVLVEHLAFQLGRDLGIPIGG